MLCPIKFLNPKRKVSVNMLMPHKKFSKHPCVINSHVVFIWAAVKSKSFIQIAVPTWLCATSSITQNHLCQAVSTMCIPSAEPVPVYNPTPDYDPTPVYDPSPVYTPGPYYRPQVGELWFCAQRIHTILCWVDHCCMFGRQDQSYHVTYISRWYKCSKPAVP